MSNIACARGQGNTTDTVFWLAQMTCVMMLINKFPHFVEPNVISGGPTNGLSIRQLFFGDHCIA